MANRPVDSACRRIIKSRQSAEDYLEIWLYIARDSPDAADRLVEQFDRHLDLLARTPLMGRSEEEFSTSLRSFPVGNYLIFYTPIEDGIELVRVLHGARNINADSFEE